MNVVLLYKRGDLGFYSGPGAAIYHCPVDFRNAGGFIEEYRLTELTPGRQWGVASYVGLRRMGPTPSYPGAKLP